MQRAGRQPTAAALTASDARSEAQQERIDLAARELADVSERLQAAAERTPRINLTAERALQTAWPKARLRGRPHVALTSARASLCASRREDFSAPRRTRRRTLTGKQPSSSFALTAPATAPVERQEEEHD